MPIVVSSTIAPCIEVKQVPTLSMYTWCSAAAAAALHDESPHLTAAGDLAVREKMWNRVMVLL